MSRKIALYFFSLLLISTKINESGMTRDLFAFALKSAIVQEESLGISQFSKKMFYSDFG